MGTAIRPEMPAMVKDFLRKVQFETDYFYIVLTYGALHGGAAELEEDYPRSISKRADYINSMVMVDNFLPVFDMTEQMQIDKHLGEQISAIKADIAAKKRACQEVTPADRETHRIYLKMVDSAPEAVWSACKVTDNCILTDGEMAQLRALDGKGRFFNMSYEEVKAFVSGIVLTD